MTRKNPTAQRGRCGALADEWEAISKRRGMSDNESYRAGDRQAAIEIELIATPAKTMTDIIAKARILKEWARQRVSVLDEDQFLARSLLADLERMAR